MKACIGCGKCCEKDLCVFGALVEGFGYKEFPKRERKPCPYLRQHDGRSWCGIYEDMDSHYKPQMARALLIGEGCTRVDGAVMAAG